MIKFLKKKNIWIALCAVLFIAASGVTFAWQVSRSVIAGGNFGNERIKINVGDLMRRTNNPAEVWAPLNRDVHHLSAEEIFEAAAARQRIKESKSENPEGDKQKAFQNQIKFTIENLGDEAAVYAEFPDIISVELATNAFEKSPGVQQDFIWFEDVLAESGINSDAVVNEASVAAALPLLETNRDKANSDLQAASGEYNTALNQYNAALRAANAAPEDAALGRDAFAAKTRLDEIAAKTGGLAGLKALEKAYSAAEQKVRNMQALKSVLTKGKFEIVNNYLVAMDNGKTRPLKGSEVSGLLKNPSREITVETFLRYGDITTELGVTPIHGLYTRNDGKAFVIQMGAGAKVDVVFSVNIPQKNFGTGENMTYEDNAYNGARIWLGADDIKVIATHNSAIAIKDMLGVDIAEGYSSLSLEDAIGFQTAE